MTTQTLGADLALFKDPGTDMEEGFHEGQAVVEFVRNGAPYRATALQAGALEVNGRHFVSMRSLLASTEFAHVDSLKETQRRLLRSDEEPIWLEPAGTISGEFGSESLTFEKFAASMRSPSAPELGILLVDGAAGVGKTTLIERLVLQRAQAGSNLPPLLHVKSAGSRLTNLKQALAVATQVLRSSVTFDQVATLVRHGVLDVAIDGFDELVDPDGYRDAWMALREFLREVACGGPILLAGRDTFFDQQGFAEEVSKRMSNLSVSHVRLEPVAPVHAFEYLMRRGWSAADVEAAEADGWLENGSYRLRPFFLAQLAELTDGWAALQSAYGSPQGFIVNRFVEREAKIVASTVEISQAAATEALHDFYATIVEDMAMNEVDTVDDSYLSLVCQVVFESRLSAKDLDKLAHKASSFGLLESNSSGGSRQFPHSELQNHFLAGALIRAFDSSAAVSSYLRRSVVAMSVASSFGEQYSTLDEGERATIRASITSLMQRERFAARLVGNLVALACCVLDRGDSFELAMGPALCHEVRFADQAAHGRLTEVQFGTLDVRGANVSQLEFDRCVVSALLMDGGSVFGESIPAVHGALHNLASTGGPIRDPDEAARVLRSQARTDARQRIMHALTVERLPFVVYFDRLVRKFASQHQIRNSDVDNSYRLLQDPLWPEAKTILERHSRLREEHRTVGGSRDLFFVVSRARDAMLLAEGDGATAAMWLDVVERARQLAGR